MRNLIKFVVCMLWMTCVDAAHSRRRYVVRREAEPRYDRSITTFSEDGVLAQVEYGMEASLRGSSVTVIASNEGICFLVMNSSLGKVHRIDHHLWLITAGLSGDARTLATALRSSCQKFRLTYGESPSTKEIARMAGQAQHELSRTGGARPLGCTAIVAGIDPSMVEGTTGRPRLYRTDPGGIVEECSFCAAGKGRDSLMKILADVSAASKSQNTSIRSMASEMTDSVLRELDDEQQSADVWMIRPHANRRGGLQTTCFRQVKLNG